MVSLPRPQSAPQPWWCPLWRGRPERRPDPLPVGKACFARSRLELLQRQGWILPSTHPWWLWSFRPEQTRKRNPPKPSAYDEPVPSADVEAARHGDRRAFERLWKLRSAALAAKLGVHSTLWQNPDEERPRREIAIDCQRDGDDELQEIALAAWKSVGGVSENFLGWLYRVGERTRNEVRAKARKRGLVGWPKKDRDAPEFSGAETPDERKTVPAGMLTFQPFVGLKADRLALERAMSRRGKK